MEYGLLGGKDKKHEMEIFMILSICFKVYILDAILVRKKKNQIMNNLEVEMNNYES